LPGWEKTPILAMTANAFSEDREACLAAGMSEHLVKPMAPEDLYTALALWLPGSPLMAEPADQAERQALPLAAEPLRSEPRFDSTRLGVLTNHNPALMQRLLQQFIDHHQDDLTRLAAHLGHLDFAAALHLVHSLKGSAGQLGDTALQELARTVEIKLRNQAVPDGPELRALENQLAQTLLQAKFWLLEQPEKPVNLSESVLGSELMPRFRTLQALLQAVDGQSLMVAEQLARDLPGTLTDDLRQAYMSVLAEIRCFDLEGAAEKMQDLLVQLETQWS
jgi:HPt (histidine-containing phosphotransfer) domain-containing protein